jgi:hypothetical protein
MGPSRMTAGHVGLRPVRPLSPPGRALPAVEAQGLFTQLSVTPVRLDTTGKDTATPTSRRTTHETWLFSPSRIISHSHLEESRNVFD